MLLEMAFILKTEINPQIVGVSTDFFIGPLQYRVAMGNQWARYPSPESQLLE
jgi:hypothetical protein